MQVVLRWPYRFSKADLGTQEPVTVTDGPVGAFLRHLWAIFTSSKPHLPWSSHSKLPSLRILGESRLRDSLRVHSRDARFHEEICIVTSDQRRIDPEEHASLLTKRVLRRHCRKKRDTKCKMLGVFHWLHYGLAGNAKVIAPRNVRRRTMRARQHTETAISEESRRRNVCLGCEDGKATGRRPARGDSEACLALDDIIGQWPEEYNLHSYPCCSFAQVGSDRQPGLETNFYAYRFVRVGERVAMK